MQIVIDIDEDIAQRIIDGKKDEPMNIVQAYPATIAQAIKEGTPLPKGHGRLIDISDIEWAKHREERNYIDYEVIDWDDIVNASTIIEADRSDAE